VNIVFTTFLWFACTTTNIPKIKPCSGELKIVWTWQPRVAARSTKMLCRKLKASPLLRHYANKYLHSVTTSLKLSRHILSITNIDTILGHHNQLTVKLCNFDFFQIQDNFWFDISFTRSFIHQANVQQPVPVKVFLPIAGCPANQDSRKNNVLKRYIWYKKWYIEIEKYTYYLLIKIQ